jgi:phenol hydroxylase P0 protein
MCACVLEIKRDLFVVFEYIAGDPHLCVELVLPFPAFAEFCSVNDVLILKADTPEADWNYKKLCNKYGVIPGTPIDEEG